SVLVGDQFNSRIRMVTPGGYTSTIAGGYVGDNNPATRAAFAAPENLAFDATGNYYVAELGANPVRRIDLSGLITTIIGNGIRGYTGDGGLASEAQVNSPVGVAADRNGNIFIADTGNAVIRKIDAAGFVSTFATDPNFSDLVSLTTDTAGNLYSADDGACV